MNLSKTFSPKKTLIITSILFLAINFFALGKAATSLSGINPENQNKVLVYQINEEAANIVLNLTFLLIPVVVVLIIVATLNFKLRNHLLNRMLMAVCFLLTFWLVFAIWALDNKYVSPTDNTQFQNQDNGELRIRSININ